MTESDGKDGSETLSLKGRVPADGGDAFQHEATFAAGLHQGAPFQGAYSTFNGHPFCGHGIGCQIGQASSTPLTYSIGDSATVAEREHNVSKLHSGAQLSQLIGELGGSPPSMIAGPSLGHGAGSIGSLGSAPQAQYPGMGVPMSSPGHVAQPGEVMGSITLPVLNMSPFPIAVAEAGMGSSPLSVSPLPGSPLLSRPIGETAKPKSAGSDSTLRMSTDSSPHSVGAFPSIGTEILDSGMATVMAKQEQMLQSAKRHSLHNDPSMHGRPVGNTGDILGGVHGDIGESCSVGQPGDVAVGQTPTPPGQLEVFYGGAESRGQRDYQQDRHTIIPHLEAQVSAAATGGKAREQLGLAAVFDGHKRCQAAELAHKRLPELLSREPGLFGDNKGSNRDEVVDAIVRSFKTLDNEILEDARKSDIKDCQYGGTTALLALLFDRVLYVAHTGDSGAVMACAAYNLKFPLRLTADHKPNRPDEHARIEDAGGNIDEGRDRVVSDPKPHNNRVTLLNMSRSLGDPQFKKGDGEPTVECMPDMRRIELQPGDTALVLASDGLWDKVSDATAVSVIDKVRAERTALDGTTAKAAAQALVDEALRQGTHDNVTAVVMLFKWP